MKVDGRPYRTIWPADDGRTVVVIDQRLLPHRFETIELRSLADAEVAIRDMAVRGAPLIGATAAYGMALGMVEDSSDEGLARAGEVLIASRPTAVNLAWAVRTVQQILRPLAPAERVERAYAEASRIAEDDVESCAAIGRHGADILEKLWKGGEPLQVLTHCNAGWLATVDWGTALSPIYAAHERGVPIHVWVDETRPRNQGAALTAWELASHGVPHTLIVDNAGGHLMRQGRVDACIVGSDRVAANGDVCNKIGTYLKALAAHDNGVPFYAAMPHSTIDFDLAHGDLIPIEEREAREVTHISGRAADGTVTEVLLAPEATPGANFAFDVTPARLVTALITERGVCEASAEGLAGLYPERAGKAA
ncbi:S-methyl-5-thioribose-1-phosphate isomerase [Brevundimonas sp. 2R-24]|uniref:Methylthioribose-1-phosphate isomerase n=1 Tax=Peiella sedimenti TaxID=3061083 RepID=A0ABT8SKH4_9CAUL|nr:S-methyl-5-thioribose-1-phosphate isomerase [Caulobacteraceae bacterium XZ-24]